MSIFPFFEDQKEQEEKYHLFAEYAYDFEKKEFLKRDGSEYIVYGDEALKIWIKKALMTDRFNYLAYDPSYGCEISSLIGQVRDVEILKLEIKRLIIECLMVNPYIVELSNFKILEDEDNELVEFDVMTIYNTVRYKAKLGGLNG